MVFWCFVSSYRRISLPLTCMVDFMLDLYFTGTNEVREAANFVFVHKGYEKVLQTSICYCSKRDRLCPTSLERGNLKNLSFVMMCFQLYSHG